MLTLEKLNALRGISSTAAKAAEPKADVPNPAPTPSPQPSVQTAPDPTQAAAPKPPTGYPAAVEIPCKNYADEQGHFAYIDANNGQISHVNLETGNIYKLEDVYRLSLQHAVNTLSPDYHRLTWQQMLNDATVYDRFGCPLFSFTEIQNAFEKYILPNLTISTEDNDNRSKTDPFGLPL